MLNASGLDDVVAAQTMLSDVDGENGVLVYRGFYATDLAKMATFEDTAHLLWFGKLPNPNEKEHLNRLFQSNRVLPQSVRDVLDHLPLGMDLMSALRTAISTFAAELTDTCSASPETAIRITAVMPTIVAYHYARAQHKERVEPDATLSHTANYLYMLTGQVPPAEQVRALEAYLILTMEHGLNASTFAARVITSTMSDMVSAVTGAIGAMKGPLHGGAPSGVLSMLREIQTKDRADAWIREQLTQGHRLMGFGHRVYKTQDPRAKLLRQLVREATAYAHWFDLAVHVEETALSILNEFKPGRQLCTNVEYWAAVIMLTTGIEAELFTPTFTCSRCVGWTAHIIEQASTGRLIRPKSIYIGAKPSPLHASSL